MAASPARIQLPVYAPVGGSRLSRRQHRRRSQSTRCDAITSRRTARTFETSAATRLAREGMLFERAVSQVPLTLPSHSSLFTGLYPPHHGVHDNGGFFLGRTSRPLPSACSHKATRRLVSCLPMCSIHAGASHRDTRPTTTLSTIRDRERQSHCRRAPGRPGRGCCRGLAATTAPRRASLLSVGASERPARTLCAARRIPASRANRLRR